MAKIAWQIDSESLFTRRPEILSTMISTRPPTRLAMTGTPICIANRTAEPRPSDLVRYKNMEAR
jgi:hypothetical protein